MAKKRKLKKNVKIIIILIAIVILMVTILFSGKALRWIKTKLGYYPDYGEVSELDIELYSDKYLLYCIDTNKVLYASNNDVRMYPASLTKVFTLDAVLDSGVDLGEMSMFTGTQRNELIAENASLAYMNADCDYSLRDLLYGLILPSGADAAAALENYYLNNGLSLNNYFDDLKEKLELRNTSFVNTTGLHDEGHYTTLDDLLLIVLDVMKYPEGKTVLTTMEHVCDDGVVLKSSLIRLKDVALGGKTGYTGEAGENLITIFELDGNNYILILGNADGNPYDGQLYHFSDCTDIIDRLKEGE